MIIEHEGKNYETTINKPILNEDLYWDCMINEVKICQSFICFDPWSLKMTVMDEILSDEKK